MFLNTLHVLPFIWYVPWLTDFSVLKLNNLNLEWFFTCVEEWQDNLSILKIVPGPSVVAYPCTHLDSLWALVPIPTALRPIQLPAFGLGKQWRMDQGLGTLYSHWRTRRAPGSCFQIGLAPTIVATWGVNHWTEIFVSVSPPLCIVYLTF